MEVVYNSENICFELSLIASLLLYEYGFMDHAIPVKKYNIEKENRKAVRQDRQAWRDYLSGKPHGHVHVHAAFSKDEKYMIFPQILWPPSRSNPTLIRVIRELGVGSHGYISDNFVIKDIPDNVDWEIRVRFYNEILFIKEKGDNSEWQEYMDGIWK